MSYVLLILSLSRQTEYRNKCEFLISVGADGEDKTIGFRLGKYKGGSCAVVGPAESCHVSAEAKRVVSEFQKFIRYHQCLSFFNVGQDHHILTDIFLLLYSISF